ncbi:GNAT family N-acetyltransferase [Alteromonas facilis]|uniref:GNAT family N-acetyltransferase n=1 Tax=Alteromonas facilis TaxID=2048004 RepID=UPI000C28F78B|nr:GNAT family N-acetyltransferase [Alteromonas facilis]
MQLEQPLEGYQVRLRNILRDDLELLRQWRNSDHVRKFMLTDGYITQEQQQAWFEHIRRATNQLHFVIEYRGHPIGSCNIKTRGQAADIFSAEHFELGLYIGDEQYAGNVIAFSPTLLMNDFCFEQLHANQLHAVVKPDNLAAMRYNEKLGYKIVNRGELFELVLDRQHYDEHSKVLKTLLNRPPRQKT